MSFHKQLSNLRQRFHSKDITLESPKDYKEKLWEGHRAAKRNRENSYHHSRKQTGHSAFEKYMSIYGGTISTIGVLVILTLFYFMKPIPVASTGILQIELIRSITIISVSCIFATFRSPEVMAPYLDKLIPMLAFLIGYFFPSLPG